MRILYEMVYFNREPNFPEDVYQMTPNETAAGIPGILYIDRNDITVLNPDGEPVAFVKDGRTFELIDNEWVLTYFFIGSCSIVLMTNEDGTWGDTYDVE